MSYKYTLSVIISEQSNENVNKFKKNLNTENFLSNITSIQITIGNVTMSNDVFLSLSPNRSLNLLMDFNTLNNAINMVDSSTLVYMLSVRACTRDLSVCSVPIYARNRALREEIAATNVIFFVKSLTSSGAFNTNSRFIFSDTTQRFTGLDIIGRELSAKRALQGIFIASNI